MPVPPGHHPCPYPARGKGKSGRPAPARGEGKREQRQSTWVATGGGLREMIRFGNTAGEARVPTREGRCVSDDQRPACSPCHRRLGRPVAQAFPPVKPRTGRSACATGPVRFRYWVFVILSTF